MVMLPDVMLPRTVLAALLFNSKDFVPEEPPTRRFPEEAFKE